MCATRGKVHIGISGSYGGFNLGDEAILQSIVTQLRKAHRLELTAYTKNEEDTRARHDVERAIAIHELTREEATEEISRLDLLILGGGGILYDRDVEMYLREVTIAHELGIPVVVYAISAGPLSKPASRKLVKEAMERVAVLTVRDRQGRKLLEEIGVRKEIILTADPALLLAPEPLSEDVLKKEGLNQKRRLVGFSVREPGPAAPDIDEHHYHLLLANSADFMVDRLDADVVFVPMERGAQDVQHSHAVVSLMQRADRASVLKGEYTPGQLMSLISHFDFCVGMRLHFLIFSALQSVPFVPLPYASKVHSFISDLEMEMPPLQRVSSGQLIARIDRSWDRRQHIRKRIQRKLPDLMRRAQMTTELVSRVLNERTTSVEESS